jgi:tRNA G18 (ribose-2'-O)-methylase SpoU
LAIEQAEASLPLSDFRVDKDEKYCFILGNEVRGVPQELVDDCDGVIEIPQEGTKHSLNIAVATGVVLWDFYQKFKML